MLLAAAARAPDRIREERDILDNPPGTAECSLLRGIRISFAHRNRHGLRADPLRDYVIVWNLEIFCDIGGYFLGQQQPTQVLVVTMVPVSIGLHDPTMLTNLSETSANTILNDANHLLLKDPPPNYTGDVYCPMLFHRAGFLDDFPDTDGTISTSQEQADIWNLSHTVAVVLDILWCDGVEQPGTVVGCANTDGIYVMRTTPANEGALWAHEYGHFKGLWYNNHSSNPYSLGYYAPSSTTRTVTQTECNAMRN